MGEGASPERANLDERTVAGFSDIWSSHDAPVGPGVPAEDFAVFFGIFPLEKLGAAEGFDMGCGSGRWAVEVAPRVGRLHCIDPAPGAIAAARRRMAGRDNVDFHLAGVEQAPLAPDSQDFGYSYGVLHHIPDPAAGLRACVRMLKPGAPFLLYLYYAFDNRPAWFRAAWRASDLARRAIWRLPFPARRAASTVLAAGVYFPLSRLARLLETLGLPHDHVPLSFYRRRDWATLRADALDRFGTRVEHRFTRAGMARMMEEAGLADIAFAPGPPYWIACGRKREQAASPPSSTAL